MLNSTIYNSLTKINSKVELYEGSTSTPKRTCSCNNELESFKVSRVGDTSKFFGFGICKQLTCTLIDLNHDISIAKGDAIKLYFGSLDRDVWDKPFPTFYVTEVERDEKSDSIHVTAYDKLYQATEHDITEVTDLTFPYDLQAVANKVCSILGLTAYFDSAALSHFKTLQFTEDIQPNYNGDEDLRTILNQIAEATQHVYYIDSSERVCFKMLRNGTATKTISRAEYFELTAKDPVILKAICNATELGENIEAEKEGVTEGITQYLKENPYLNLREPTEVADYLNAAINLIGGLTITPFNCDWDADYRVQPFDSLALEASGGTEYYSFFICDTLGYSGTLSQTTEWEYNQDKDETATNSSNLGEILNQTYAKVDKSAREITLLSSEVKTYDDRINATESELATLQINTASITASVQSIENSMSDTHDTINENIEKLAKEVNLKMSSEEVEIAISSSLENGINKVTTSTGFTFDSKGLNISKSGSELVTLISEDGMTIEKSGAEVLVADNQGVRAEDLHATTFLIIGDNSRFENFGSSRTACFWIGGNE